MKAATQPRGADRLRELVVFPEMSVNFNFGMGLQGNEVVVNKIVDDSSQISRVREELKAHPDDVQRLLQLGTLLDSDGQTNESNTCYQKVEQLCRNKANINPQDGLNLTDLGEALSELGKREEAEIFYRKATLVSSNEWKCWVRRGNFLANEYYFTLFPENMRSQISTGQIPSQGVLDYRPPIDALTKSEASCNEASRCFDQAVALAPKEPEVFFQRAGYMSVSNWQNCFFRSFRDSEKIEPTTWLLANFSKDTIADLKKAAELDPRNYEYISLAAYFEWINSTMHVNNGLKFSRVPDAASLSIHDAMTQLEELSQSPDKKLAAGALENLGMLSMLFGNSPVATANFRQALALDPTREQAWDLLLGTLTISGTPEEKVAACEARLKVKDSARNHLLLARAFQHQKKWDKASEQSEAALKIQTNNFVAELELLALELKQSANPEFMSKAEKRFDRLYELYGKLPINNDSLSYWRQMTLNQAILYGLINTPEYKETARACVEGVLKRDPNDKQAKVILAAL